MARPREFNQDEVLERAMMLFWAQGYEATSVRDLTAATGISSSSMYEVFTDKRGLFLTALARYCEIEQARIQLMAQEATSPRAFIETLFMSLDLMIQGRSQGSFAFNTMVELGTRDPDVTRQLLDHYFKIADIIAGVIAPVSSFPPQHLAHTILTTLQGVATIKGVKPDFPYHQAITDVILNLLSQP